MKLKDRPGPWKVFTSSEYPTNGLVIMDQNMDEVCSLCAEDVNIDGDEIADLIATLPEMVFVIQNVREILYRNTLKEQPDKADVLQCWQSLQTVLERTGMKL